MRKALRLSDPTLDIEVDQLQSLGYVPQREMTRHIEETGKSGNAPGLAVSNGDNLLSREIRQIIFGDGLQATSDGDRATVTIGPHFVTNGLRPTYTLAVGAGTGATASVTGNDISGLIQIVAGTTPATGVQITFKFARPFKDTNYGMILTPSSSAARALDTNLGTSTKAVGSVQLASSTALTAGSTYEWNYFIAAFNGTS